MASDWMQILLETTLSSSAAILLVLALRPVLKRTFGARVAYAAWALVPALSLAVLLPAPTSAVVDSTLLANLPAQVGDLPYIAGGRIAAWPSLALAGWLAGVLAAAGAMALAQHRFRRRLGALQPQGAHLRATSSDGALPATLGVWRPQVVVPADFEMRFDEAQRALVLAHEHAHVARGDLQVNALAALLRCLFWFNPLVLVAASRFRHDQELACDADVLARQPHARRAYGEALFQAQVAMHTSPLGCHFGFGHPLKERIAMLKEPVPTYFRRRTGTALITALTLAAGVSAWAAQPQKPPAANDAEVTGVSMPAPAYPEAAEAQRIGGQVSLIIDVAADGSVAGAKIDKSEPAGVFDAAALATVKTWKFQPEIKDGKPIASRIRVPIRFDPPTGDGNG